MSTIDRHSNFSDHSSAENTKILSDPNASFTVYYWGMTSAGSTARDLLAYGKASWKNVPITFESWAAGTYKTPFRSIPTLAIRSEEGKEATLAESIVVDQFLAKRFHLLGDNEWEEFQIKGFYSNIHYLRERSFMNVTWTHADKRKIALEKFLTKTLPSFIEDHEFHLKANGANGHYVGDKLTLADIHLANVIDHFSHLPAGKTITAIFKTSELLWKVKEEVEKNPEIAAWRQTEEWKRFDRYSVEVYSVTAPPADEETKEE
ncbi:Glutathione S-transferase S1 [Mortierella antarctica]|nr:Glutathione S-transferase S1 [Mortierella antarctica]